MRPQMNRIRRAVSQGGGNAAHVYRKVLYHMVSPENRVSTCRSCHPGANANFAAFKPHGNPHDREGEPILYYTRLFMVWLLIGVFSFFGLHTLLWMLRELKEVSERRRRR